MNLPADSSTDDPSARKMEERVRVTGERTAGDEERFVAVTIEARAPTSVTGSVALAVVPSQRRPSV